MSKDSNIEINPDDPVSLEKLYTRHKLYRRGTSSSQRESTNELAGLFAASTSDDISEEAHKHYFGRGTIRLADFLAEREIVNHLFKANTFIHGKVEFYRFLLARLHEFADTSSEQIVYWEKLANLPKKAKTVQRAVLVPKVKSEAELNSLVVSAFVKTRALWLIAPPVCVQKHLLLAFSNFFIASAPETELSTLKEVLQLPKDVRDKLADLENAEVLFATNFKPLLDKSKAGTLAYLWIDLHG
jgi:hypothetical protein